jgi:glucan biosynthesis protein C
MICAPLFAWLISPAGKRRLQGLEWLGKGGRVYLLPLVSVLLFVPLVHKFPETNDLVHDALYFPYWLLFVLGGFLCVACASLTDSLERNRRTSFLFAFLCIVLLDYLRWNDLEPWKLQPTTWLSDPRTYLYFALYPVTAWSWVMTAIGYGKKYLNRPHPSLSYLNQAVYPFYILHQTIIIIVVFYIIRTPDTIGMKYIFTVILSFFLSMAIYHLLIRPFAITRFLFGMKPKAKKIRTGRNARNAAGHREKPLLADIT